MANHDEYQYLLEILYLLAGMRPETRYEAARLAADLLERRDDISKSFADQPKLPAMLDRYCPFAEGNSRGAGDPADLHLFFSDLDGSTDTDIS